MIPRCAARCAEAYDHDPETLRRAGRSVVLSHVLESPVIDPEAVFRARLEVPARANLARKIAGPV